MKLNDEHPPNKLEIEITLLVFHFDISGKDFNDEQPQKVLFILVNLLVFHFDISVNILMMNNL